MKLSLSQLERARRAPKSVAAAQLREFGGIKPTFAGYWVFAAKLYHKLAKANDRRALKKAHDYFLQHCRLKLSSDPDFDNRVGLFSRRLDEYVQNHSMLGQPTVQTNKRVLFGDIPGHLISGTIGRLDIVPAGGFAATNYEAKASDWKSQLRTAIIQQALAQELGRSFSEIRVGMYCIDAGEHEYVTLDEAAIQAAIAELTKVLNSVESEVQKLRAGLR